MRIVGVELPGGDAGAPGCAGGQAEGANEKKERSPSFVPLRGHMLPRSPNFLPEHACEHLNVEK
jgi:hypothetical protein